jgi:hypothetical protein
MRIFNQDLLKVILKEDHYSKSISGHFSYSKMTRIHIQDSKISDIFSKWAYVSNAPWINILKVVICSISIKVDLVSLAVHRLGSEYDHNPDTTSPVFRNHMIDFFSFQAVYQSVL